jgi:AraC-like DNA-binding protein
MGLIAALLPNPDRLYRLHAALRGRHTVEACRDWAMLRRLCDTQPVHLVVVDLYAEGSMSLEPLRQLKRQCPRLIAVAYVSVALERVHDVFDAGRAGLDGLVVADRDDTPTGFASILEQAEARGIAGVLRGALIGFHPAVRDAVLVAVTRAHERLTTETLARTVAASRRLLTRRLLDAGFPPPQRLLTWGRLIIAAQMLEDRNRSADGVALALRFPSGSAFRNTCQRYLRATPTELRELGGSSYVIDHLLQPALLRRPPLPATQGAQQVPAGSPAGELGGHAPIDHAVPRLTPAAGSPLIV